MSIAVAVRREGKVAVVCDSRVTDGDRVYYPRARKAVHVGDFIVACVGDWRSSRHYLASCGMIEAPTAVTVETLAELLDSSMGEINNQEHIETMAVDKTTGDIYLLEEGTHPLRLDTDYHAIGSGETVALAAYHALNHRKNKNSAVYQASICVEVACKLIPSCGDPLVVLTCED